MNRLEAAQQTLLVAWFGAAMLTAAVVAPEAFRVLPSRALAGALVGQVLPVIFVVGLAVGVLAWVMEWPLRRRAMPDDKAHRLKRIAFFAMAFCCYEAQFVVSPKIAALRASVSGPIESLDPADATRLRFGRLHGVSVGLLGVAMLSAATAVVTIFMRPSTHHVDQN